MRLNLGCGEFRADGWVNVDCHAGVKPDVVADLASLPFTDGTADQVYAGHVFEHVALDDLPAVLDEIRRVLVTDGTLMVVGPDIDRARKDWPEAVPDIECGEGRWPGDAHLWESRESTTLDLLTECGWRAAPIPIADVPSGWPVTSRIGWQFAIGAW